MILKIILFLNNRDNNFFVLCAVFYLGRRNSYELQPLLETGIRATKKIYIILIKKVNNFFGVYNLFSLLCKKSMKF